MAFMIMTLMILISVICCASINNNNTISSRSSNIVNDDELVVAMEEMHKANYFTFIMLIKMAVNEGGIFRSSNVTFLMPNDRMLSKITLPENTVTDFLLRHSIPSPLLFHSLQLIPTGSVLPSSKAGYILHISNNGRRNYSVNSVKIISPNICSSSSTSIRCHGIAGVLLLSSSPNPTLQLPSVANESCSPLILSDPSPSPALSPIPIGTNPNPKPQNSGASHISPVSTNLSRLPLILLQYFTMTCVLLQSLSTYTRGY